MKLLGSVVAALWMASGVAVEESGSFMNAAGAALMARKEAYWAEKVAKGAYPRKDVRSVLNQAATCSGGSVTVDGEPFPCDNIDFESFISLSDLFIPDNGGSTQGSDIWGWLSPQGREITLMLVDNGLRFIDSTNPSKPLNLGYLPSGRPRAS